jgi:hypothetical protein
MADCKDLPGSAVDTVLFTIRLVGYEATHGPARILKALQSPALQAELKRAILKVANENLEKQRKGERVGPRDAAATLGKAVGGAARTRAPGKLLSEIQRSSRYRRLEQSIKDLRCAYKRSPAGVWIDEHKALLIIAVAGVVVGGVTAMYVTRSGDAAAEALTKFANSRAKPIPLGQIKLGVSDLKFVPSKRLVGGKLTVEPRHLKSVRTKLSLSVATQGKGLESLSVNYQLLVPLTSGWTGQFKGGVGTEGYQLMLGVTGRRDGLSLDLAAQVKKDPEEFSYGAKAGLKYVTKLDGRKLEVKAGLGVDRTWKLDAPVPARPETNVALSLSAAWRF